MLPAALSRYATIRAENTMNDLDKIKQKIDIVDFIGQYVALKKSGRNFTALCPFHNEKSPSFVISPERNIWHCFGCSKGGDTFTFLMEYSHIDFGEALRELADRAGVQITSMPALTETERKRDKILKLNALSLQFYHFLLTSHPLGKPALEYLLKVRKIPKPLVDKFRIGYAPNSFRALTRYLIQKRKIKKEDLFDAGLVAEKNGKIFDFFRHRIIFPIANSRGDIIAFSGRALDNTTFPKYINTRETLLYKKGDTLFGLDLAVEEIKRQKKVILVEGEFDVISAFHSGIQNIVAIKGTALTESQIKILKRYAEKILFCFDSDVAGTRAQQRSIGVIEKMGLLANVIRLPQGKDPDELLKTSPADFKRALKNDISVYDFIIESNASELALETVEGKSEMIKRALPFLLSIQNEVIKEHYIKKLAQILNASIESLIKEGQKMTLPQKPITAPNTQKSRSQEELAEEYLLSLLLQSENPAEHCILVSTIVSDISFSIPACDRLFHYLKDFCDARDTFSINEFARKLPSELLPTFDRCLLAPVGQFKTTEDHIAEIEKTAKKVKFLAAKNKLRELSSQIRQKEKSGREEDVRLIQVEFKRLTEMLR